jgi:hypothetical protein
MELTGVLQQARNQQLHYDHRATSMYRREVVDEASTQLEVNGFHRWRSNYMSDLFSACNGESEVLLKLVLGKPPEAVDAQFCALQELFALAGRSGTFRVPAPLLNLVRHSAYVMEKVHGEPLTKSISSPVDVASLVAFVRKCGAGLAAIHQEWREDPGPFPMELIQDFDAHSPWALGHDERQMLNRLRAAVGTTDVQWSRLYLDFDPVNVLIDHSQIPVFIDPPDTTARGPIHWDLGVFTLGIERSLWRRPLSLRQGRALAACLRSAFVDAYGETSGRTFSTLDEILLEFCEVVRLAQLALWWGDYGRLRRRLKGWARSTYTSPLIRASWCRHAARIEAQVGEFL